MIPVTVATWYITSSEPRMRCGADSAMNTGATTTDTPMVRPSSSRATTSDGTLQASPLSSENSAKVAATPTITGLRPEPVGQRAADQRAGDLADHHRRGDQALGVGGQAELGRQVEQRTGDVGRVVAVDGADGGGARGDADGESRGLPEFGEEAHGGLLSVVSSEGHWSIPISVR